MFENIFAVLVVLGLLFVVIFPGGNLIVELLISVVLAGLLIALIIYDRKVLRAELSNGYTKANTLSSFMILVILTGLVLSGLTLVYQGYEFLTVFFTIIFTQIVYSIVNKSFIYYNDNNIIYSLIIFDRKELKIGQDKPGSSSYLFVVGERRIRYKLSKKAVNVFRELV
jgi:cell division protein FtsL